jgi:hypothetical protein
MTSVNQTGDQRCPAYHSLLSPLEDLETWRAIFISDVVVKELGCEK